MVHLWLWLGGCTVEDRLAAECRDYCRAAVRCDDEVDLDACTDDCIDTTGDCQADELEAVIEDLDRCAEESCDDLGACTVGAALQCFFGV